MTAETLDPWRIAAALARRQRSSGILTLFGLSGTADHSSDTSQTVVIRHARQVGRAFSPVHLAMPRPQLDR
jgi:hypothetical protein